VKLFYFNCQLIYNKIGAEKVSAPTFKNIGNHRLFVDGFGSFIDFNLKKIIS
jgi:hypothetical protein